MTTLRWPHQEAERTGFLYDGGAAADHHAHVA